MAVRQCVLTNKGRCAGNIWDTGGNESAVAMKVHMIGVQRALHPFSQWYRRGQRGFNDSRIKAWQCCVDCVVGIMLACMLMLMVSCPLVSFRRNWRILPDRGGENWEDQDSDRPRCKTMARSSRCFGLGLAFGQGRSQGFQLQTRFGQSQWTNRDRCSRCRPPWCQSQPSQLQHSSSQPFAIDPRFVPDVSDCTAQIASSRWCPWSELDSCSGWPHRSLESFHRPIIVGGEVGMVAAILGPWRQLYAQCCLTKPGVGGLNGPATVRQSTSTLFHD